ncbi:MAG: ATP-dependent sacrificial sulfur transferase LarE [Dehalococcoidia bacterium]
MKIINSKLKNLEKILFNYGSVIVAFSGGVDSTFLMFMANKVLGSKSIAVTAKSPSIAPEELDFTIKIAKNFSWEHMVINTMEFQNPDYIKNNTTRCFYCKTELYTHLGKIAEKLSYKNIINGANLDDTSDFRPGMKAAKQHHVFSPLIESKLTKKEIRQLSKELNLPTWDKPAQPCLASRIPYGTPVSINALSKIGQAEAGIRKLGFNIIRVRHYNELARIEIPIRDFEKFYQKKKEIQDIIFDCGYDSFELDKNGFKSGNLNKNITKV